MARLSKALVHAAIDQAALHILSARGEDPVISRRDIRRKLSELEGVEKRLTDMLYRFIDHRDHKPGARVTKKDVDETIAYVKEKLIDAYDENNNGFSRAEVEKMSTTGRLAVSFARLIQSQGGIDNLPTAVDRIKSLHELGEGRYFPAYANEADAYLRPFFQEASLEQLTAASFSEALGLDQSNPAEKIYRFEQGRSAYQYLFTNYADMNPDNLPEFIHLHEMMQQQLRQITHIIVGEDGLREESTYPVYFVGLTEDGDIAGFETETVWT